MIAMIDYGLGNLFSLRSSFAAVGEEIVLTADAELISRADKLVLPGVGGFPDAICRLADLRLDEIIKKAAASGKPMLGVCLGMQLLFDKSLEHGENKGLGLIKGEVRAINEFIPKNYKKIHIGWNALSLTGSSPIFKYVDDGEYVYFVHSYAAVGCEAATTATAEYGAMLTAAVQQGNIFGCQFHPEKSGDTGLRILKAFCEL